MRFDRVLMLARRLMTLFLFCFSAFLSVWAMPAAAQSATETLIQFEARAYSGVEGTEVVVDITREVSVSGDFIDPASAFIQIQSPGTTMAGDFSSSIPLRVDWDADETGTQQIVIFLIEDGMVEDAETFVIEIADVSGSATGFGPIVEANITINDAPSLSPNTFVQFQSTTYSGVEGNSVDVVVERVLAPGATDPVSSAFASIGVVDGSAIPSADFDFNSQTLSWDDGDTDPQVITIELTDDLDSTEGSEDFILQIVSTDGDTAPGSPDQTAVTIADANPGELSFSGQPYTVQEGDTIDITVVRSGGSDGQVNVTIGAEDITANLFFDFELVGSRQLNWADGESGARTLTYRALVDSEQDSDETFQLFELDGFRNNGPGSVDVTIIDVPPPPAGEIQFSDSIFLATEGEGSLVVTVERVNGEEGPATVQYAITADTAEEGSDFIGPLTGELSWADGNDDSQLIDILLVDDDINELTERLVIELLNATGAELGSMSFAVGEITDDDDPPMPGVVNFDMSVYDVSEQDGFVTLTVQRTGGFDGAVSVDVQIEPGTASFPEDGGFLGDEDVETLEWDNNEGGSKSVLLFINADTDSSEGQESFTVFLDAPSNGLAIGGDIPSAIVTINDAPPPPMPGTLSFVSDYTVSEATGSVRLEVTRSNGADGRVTAQYTLEQSGDSATPILDYVDASATPGELVWEDGDSMSKFIDVDIALDTLNEGDEFFTAFIEDVTGSPIVANDTSQVTITDTPPPLDDVQFEVASISVAEDVGTFDVVVQRVGSGIGPVEVFYEIESGSATFGDDFEAPFMSSGGTVFWQDGDLADKTIPITVILDTDDEGAHDFTVQLENGSSLGDVNLGTPSLVTVTINDLPPVVTNDVVQFVLAQDSVTETDGSIDLVLQRVGSGIGQISVAYDVISGTATRDTDFREVDIPGVGDVILWADGDLANKTLTVNIFEDLVVDPDETFSVQLSISTTSGNVILGSTDETNITIIDVPPPARGDIAFDPDSYSVSELDGSVELTVTRSGGSAGQIIADYEVLGGTAVLGTDHAITSPQTGTLTWADGDTTPRLITIDIADDSAIETDESFMVNLTTPGISVPVIIDSATVNIVDTTQPDSITLTDSELEIAEDAGVLSLTVQRTGTGTEAVSVLYSMMDGTALAGEDYADTLPVTGTVSWAAGDLADKFIEVDIATDNIVDQDETFLLNLALDPASQIVTLGTPAQTLVTITDVAPPAPGVLQFDPDEYTVAEVDGVVELQVTRTGGSDGPASAEYEVIAGTATIDTDIAIAEPTTGMLDWPAGDDSPRTIVVDIATDDDIEGDESFTVNLSGIAGAVAGTATTASVTLMDSTVPAPDAVVMADANVSVEESAGSIEIVVQRVGSGADAISVAYDVTGDTASVDLDFTAGDISGRILSWAAGDIADKTIVIDVLEDALVEANETLVVTLSTLASSAPVLIGTPDNTIVTIIDTTPPPVPDVISLVESEQSRQESETAFVVAIQRDGDGSGASSVNWTVLPGSASASTDIDLEPLTGTVSWDDGQTGERTVTIPIVSDSVDEADETLTFILSGIQGAVLGTVQSATLIIVDDDDAPEPGTIQFATDTFSVDEDAGVVVIDVSRVNGNDGLISVIASTMTGSAGQDDFSTIESVIAWPDGDSNTRQLVVPITFDSVTDPDESFTVVLGNATPDDGVLGSPSIATVVINDVFNGSPGTVQFASGALSVDEDDTSVTATVTRTGGSDGRLSVNYSTNAGSASARDDFEATRGTLVWADGDDSPKRFSVAIVEDTVSEGNEQFTAVLSGAEPFGNASIGSPDTVRITIVNVEPPPEPEPEPEPQPEPEIQRGTLQFVSATSSVDESDGTVSVSVARTGGSDGTVSVRYETVDGSAVADDDFDPVSGRLQWADGESDVRIVRIAIDVDSQVEPDEQFQLVLSDVRPQDGVLGARRSATITIEDDSTAPPGVLAFTDITETVAEADSRVTLRVSRTGGSAGAVSVRYSTRARSADETDFEPTSGRLSWGDGDTGVRTLRVPVNRDGLVEPNEQFQVVLSGAEPLGDSQQLGRSVATVSITDSTRLGNLGFEFAELSVTEREGSITLSVSRSDGADGAISVDYALIGGSAELGVDVVDQRGTLNWADLDDQPKSITVLINADNQAEGNEQFMVALSNAQPLGAQQISVAQATVNIIDTTVVEDDSVPQLASLGDLDLVVVSGDGQGGLPGDVLEPLVIDVVDRGASDATVAGTPILWRAIPEGSAELLDSGRTVSDEDGSTSNRVRILSRGFVRVVATIDVAPAPVAGLAARNNPPPFPVGQGEAVFTVRSGIGPAAGLRTNQANIGTALDVVCEVLSVRIAQQQALTAEEQDLFDTCQEVEARLADDAGLGAALDRLLPEEFFLLGDAIINTTDIQITNVYARINAIRSGQVDLVDLSGLQFSHYDQSIPGSVIEAAKDGLSGGGAGASADETLSQMTALGFFASGSISYGELDGGELQSDAEFRTTGVTLGADYRANDTTVFGVGIGIADNDTDFTSDGGSAQINGFNVTLFATYYAPEKGYLDAVLDVGHNDIDVRRRINLPDTPDQFGISDTTADVLSLTIGAGRDYRYGDWEFGPYGRVSFIDANIDGFSERAAGSEEGFGSVLTVESHSVHSRRLALGGQVARTVNTKRGVLIPQLRVEAEFESETRKDGIEARFQHDPSQTPFVVNGEDRDSSYINLGIGSSALFPHGRSGFIFYETQLGNDRVTQHWLKLGLRLEF